VRSYKIVLGAVVLASLTLIDPARSLCGEEPGFEKQTIAYKTVGPTKIEADVYRRNGHDARPCVVWIHGGALIMGNRDGVPGDIKKLCQEQNYVLVSLDYRLAPEVKLPAIIEDVKDAFRWIHSEGTAQFHIDPKKILVSGGSAGGYLTLMTGICVEPRPKALVAYWGYGDIDAPWYIEPSAHYRKQLLVSEDEARSVVGGPVLTDSRSGDKNRGRYYLFLRQNGLWTREVAGFEPIKERAKIDPYCPVRNVTPQYPPTLLVHGTADTDVDYQESADMAKELARQGVRHELITVENGGHGLGRGGGDPKAIADAFARAIEFMREQLD
jgi:acetyl esterase/lipase